MGSNTCSILRQGPRRARCTEFWRALPGLTCWQKRCCRPRNSTDGAWLWAWQMRYLRTAWVSMGEHGRQWSGRHGMWGCMAGAGSRRRTQVAAVGGTQAAAAVGLAWPGLAGMPGAVRGRRPAWHAQHLQSPHPSGCRCSDVWSPWLTCGAHTVWAPLTRAHLHDAHATPHPYPRPPAR